MFLNQEHYMLRCEWGQEGIGYLGPISDVIIIVDIMSFSTAIDVAVSRGAIVFPSAVVHEQAYGKALENNAVLAGPRTNPGYNLSPASLLSVKEATRLVLPSINGSTLTMIAENIETSKELDGASFFMQKIIMAGCIRNAQAVAKKAVELGRSIAVIPAGERWPDNTMRFAIEDLYGAGALIEYIIHFMQSSNKYELKFSDGLVSPEARTLLAGYQFAKHSLFDVLKECATGRFLIERGFEQDVYLASQLNVSTAIPQLIDGAYRNVG